MGVLKVKVGTVYVPVPVGAKGDDSTVPGPPGPSTAITVGTTTTTAAGTPATVELAGTNPDYTLNVSVPMGPAGVGNTTRHAYTTLPASRPPVGAGNFVEWIGPIDPASLAIANDTWVPTA